MAGGHASQGYKKMLGGVKKGAGVRSEADDSVWAKGQMIQAMPAGVGVRSHAVHLRGFRPFLTLGPFLWYNGLTDIITHVARDHRTHKGFAVNQY